MPNYFEISHLVPLNFVDLNRELPLTYNFKHFDAWKSHEQKLPYEQGDCYYQKWQKNDIIFLQVKSNYDPVFVKVINAITNEEVDNFQMDVMTGSVSSAIYLQAQIALDDYDDGYYKVRLLAGDPIQKILESETFHVMQEHENTLLFNYTNNVNNNILYETGQYFLYRLEGVIVYDRTVSRRTIFMDQTSNAATVKGTPHRIFKLYTGNNGGMPNWMADKLVEIFDQTSVEIDGKGFSAADSAELSPSRVQRYAWAQWQMDILETNNSRVKRFETEGLQDKKVAIDYDVNKKLFGPIAGSANDNTVKIQEIT